MLFGKVKWFHGLTGTPNGSAWKGWVPLRDPPNPEAEGENDPPFCILIPAVPISPAMMPGKPLQEFA